MSFITKKEVTQYLKDANHDEIHDLIENAMMYTKSPDNIPEPSFHTFSWDGAAETFKKVPEQIRETELLLKSPELGWVSSVIHNCYIYYTEYGLEQMDTVILSMYGRHYICIKNNRAEQSGRSLVISYDVIRNNITAIRNDNRSTQMFSLIKRGFVTLLAVAVLIGVHGEIKKIEWDFWD